ncbi:MAG: MarR family transcriptional regulator [Planctomycetota bacterium]|nr:MarR family transcriptional regulator [Planctomycetota bacterium]
MSRSDPSALAQELGSSKPFVSLEVEAHLSLVRTSDQLKSDAARFLKGYGVSAPQYNVLRILRGAGADGLASSGVAERMVERVPDVTRLLDRLAAKSWVRRERSEFDRRVVTARITPKGLRLLASLDEPLVKFHAAEFAGVPPADLKRLVALLDKVRRARAQATKSPA